MEEVDHAVPCSFCIDSGFYSERCEDHRPICMVCVCQARLHSLETELKKGTWEAQSTTMIPPGEATAPSDGGGCRGAKNQEGI